MQLTTQMLAEIDHIQDRMDDIQKNVFGPKLSAIVMLQARCCQSACTCPAIKELNLHKVSLEIILTKTDLKE